MKKITISSLLLLFLFVGCTTPEQDMQIKTFWQTQAYKAMMKFGPAIMNLYTKVLTKRMGNIPGYPMGASAFNAGNNNFDFADVKMARREGYLKDGNDGKITDKDLELLRSAKSATADANTNDSNAFDGVAPLEDRIRMKRAFTATQRNNQYTIDEVGKHFNENTKNIVKELVQAAERRMKEKAATATSFSEYLEEQRKIQRKLTEEDLPQIMHQNASSIKPIKTTKKRTQRRTSQY